MNESVGNSLLLYLVIFIVGAIMLFYVGIISYSKAYRVKDNLIEIIEKHYIEGYSYDGSNPSAVQNEINLSLKQSGYSVVNGDKIKNLCTSGRVAEHIKQITGGDSVENLHNVGNSYSDYNYCVFKIEGKSAYEHANYYIVVTFVHFDFPVIGDRLNIPVYGETKMLNKKYDY